MKNAIIMTLVVALVVIGGCVRNQDKANQQSTLEENTTEQAEEKKGLTVVDRSLAEWFKSDQGVECRVEDEDGEVVTQVKGEKSLISGIPYVDMKSRATSSDEMGYHLSDGEWVYMWSGKQGTKMNLAKIQEMAKDIDSPEQDQPETWDEILNDWENSEAKYYCENKRLSDDLFIPPSNVEFADFTAAMEGMMQLGKELEEKMGDGASMEAMDLEALQKMTEEIEKQMKEAGFDEEATE